MIVRVGVENNPEGRSVAWALDHPGCFAYGPDGASAVVAMGRAIPRYIQWMETHTTQPWFNPADIDIRLEEVWEDYQVDADMNRTADGLLVNAWFQSDWKPLAEEEVRQGLLLLEWSRADLLEAFHSLSPEQLDRPIPGERWTIRGILAHVGTTSWWLMDRLDLAAVPRSQLPKDVDERAHTQFERMKQVMAELAGVKKVIGKDGEFWSPRKLLRRAVWHDRDHWGHVCRLAGEGKET